MRRIVAGLTGMLVWFVLLSALVAGSPDSPAPTITAVVLDIVDGSILEVSILAVTDATPVFVGDTVRVRCVGIELTENAAAFWEVNASLYTDIIVGQRVYLAVDPAAAIAWTRGIEPLPAYVYLDPAGKTLINSILIAMGFAEASTTLSEVKQTRIVDIAGSAEAHAAASYLATAGTAEVPASAQGVTIPAQSPPAATVSWPVCGGCCTSAWCMGGSCQEPLTLIDLTSCVRPGDYARLEIQTVPGAWCQIEAGYHSGLSFDPALGSRLALCGTVRWRWKVTAHTPPGTWPIIVTARVNGEILAQLQTCITVREAL